LQKICSDSKILYVKRTLSYVNKPTSTYHGSVTIFPLKHHLTGKRSTHVASNRFHKQVGTSHTWPYSSSSNDIVVFRMQEHRRWVYNLKALSLWWKMMKWILRNARVANILKLLTDYDCSKQVIPALHIMKKVVNIIIRYQKHPGLSQYPVCIEINRQGFNRPQISYRFCWAAVKARVNNEVRQSEKIREVVFH